MWKSHCYSNEAINKAGRAIVNSETGLMERKNSLKIVNEFRAAHAFPTNTFAINLKHKVDHIKSAMVVQRIKRLDTIMYKLDRFPSMQLSRMQDIGGCRVVVPNIEDVYTVVKSMRDSRIRHIEHTYKDYIAIPNPNTGYRGYHLVYKYLSDRRTEYNGMFVEIQIRTELQHVWATTVETVGLFTDNGLKFNAGSKDWLRFFKLTSALISIEENSAVVEGVPADFSDIFLEWVCLIEKLDVIGVLGTIGLATTKVGRVTKNKNEKGYYLITLDYKKGEVDITPFMGMEKSLEAATEAYNKVENMPGNYNSVLVSAQSYETLVKAYPNYFMDVRNFLEIIIMMVEKYKSTD